MKLLTLKFFLIFKNKTPLYQFLLKQLATKISSLPLIISMWSIFIPLLKENFHYSSLELTFCNKIHFVTKGFFCDENIFAAKTAFSQWYIFVAICLFGMKTYSSLKLPFCDEILFVDKKIFYDENIFVVKLPIIYH